MTFSILGRDPASGELGIAVQSKFPGAGTLVPHGRVGVGVIASQAFANPGHGSRALGLLALGALPDEVPAIVLRGDDDRARRQLAVLGPAGGAGTFTGEEVLSWDGWAGHAAGTHCIAIGNSLAGPDVVERMVQAFEAARGEFAERLIGALQAGQGAGGELRGQQSASVLVFREDGGYGGQDGRHVDIPVYDHPAPIDELERCYRLHRLSWFPSDPQDLIPIDAALARELKALLRRRGFLPEGHPEDDAQWDQTAIAAMQRFMGTENYDNRLRDDALIDLEVLADIRQRYGSEAPKGL